VHSTVAEAEPIVTGPESKCSVLFESSSLIQFCGEAAVQLRHDRPRNATLLDVQRGATRAVIGKRAPDAPLEIRTPVAIAEIRGTVIDVSVDPASGDSTFSLEEGEVRIKGRENGSPTVTLRAGEQVTIRNGRPSKVTRFRLEDLRKGSTCPADVAYRQTAVQQDRGESQAIDQITVADIPEKTPEVGSGPSVPRLPNNPIGPWVQTPSCLPSCVGKTGNTSSPAPPRSPDPPARVSFPNENGIF